MKYVVFAVLCLIGAQTANAQFSNARLEATGLTCALCTKAINSALEALPYIEKVDVDIVTTSFLIDFKSNTAVDIDGIRKAVEDAGFSVGKLTLTGQFDNVAVKNDEHVKINDHVFHFVKIKPQTLAGEQSVTIVDKNFLTAKTYKTYQKATSKACMTTGKAADCCDESGAKPGERIYHVTI